MNYVRHETEASSTTEVETVPNHPAKDVSSDRVPTTEELSEHLDAVRLHADRRLEASESSNYRLGAGRYLAP